MDKNEKSRLIENNTKDYEKLNLKLFIKLLGFLILLFLIYIVYNIVNNSIEPKSNNTIKLQTPLHISSFDTTNDDYLIQCAPRVICDPNAKYRNINGSCNNLKIPTWGASKTPFLRLLVANYSDGYYKLREQANGPLPNVRLLNTEIFMAREQYRVDENNVLLVPYGQLLAHDMTGMTIDALQSSDGVVTSCCDENARRTAPQCVVAFDIPPNDPVYSKHGIRCQVKYRFRTSRNYSCPLHPTTYINDNTHFLDASEIYGSIDNATQRLRTMEGGRLNFSTNSNGQMFCPYQKVKKNQPKSLKELKFLYDGGNPGTVNQNLGITAISTLFLRFHNYIAFKLSTLNPFWSDEIIFQESRRIVIASIQHTTYKDFLPIIIGKDYQELYGLNEENVYDPEVNPSISQEWSTAAYRVLHKLIPVQFNLMNSTYNVESSVIITEWMTDPELLPIDNNFDKLFKGFLETAGRVNQPSYNFYISNYMLHKLSKPAYTGYDLMSDDLTAGRDVGLQPYNKLRNLCGLPLAENFEDLLDIMHISDVKKLKELYDTVDDIDALVGLLLEKPSDGALVGPTSQCLIADVFYRTKVGDRFFYDVRGQPSSFTFDQLEVIKKIALGHVICASSNVDHVQKDIFKTVDHNLFPTSKLKCDDEFYIDLSAWKETPNKSEL